jgi:PI-3-kinase-related kinase SMG-1
MMLAKLSPWSIVYPTLVDVNTNEEPSEELQHILGCLVMEILSFNLLDSVAFVFFTMYLIWITVTI